VENEWSLTLPFRCYLDGVYIVVKSVLRLLLYAIGLLSLVSALLCVGGLAIGGLLHAITPSLDYGMASLISVIALSFAILFLIITVVSIIFYVEAREQESSDFAEPSQEDESEETVVVHELEDVMGWVVPTSKNRLTKAARRRTK